VALVSLYGVSDLSNIMSNYLDEVWFREMTKLMVMVMLLEDSGKQEKTLMSWLITLEVLSAQEDNLY
jgi:general stress protein CsbA